MQDIGDLKDWGGGKDTFELVECSLLERSPTPGFVLSCQEIQGGNDVRKVWDKLPVKVCKSGEGSHSLHQSGWFPVLNGLQFLSVHFHLSLTNDQTQKFHLGGIKDGFGQFHC